MKKVTLLENEELDLAFIKEYDGDTGKTSINVAKLNKEGNYNINDGKPFKDFFNIKGDVTTSANYVAVVCADDELANDMHKLLMLQCIVDVKLTYDNKIEMKIWL